ncbi:hypothetical protein R69658_06347 [Paraburkholderia aspalathi]|jgi:hypothetical protein|uniref:Uncharacterized protein n=1 Tax=Paraburkholderia aspalathi TaxID=1324617 RepID=A0A1I7DU56_9BURK|nr:hypothetical protein [Paraburkholderia sediminicola]CAE6758010.1 hypothetical protein R69746_03263 [Paraburkholderia aspalathi]CAE6832425.1 hypothetical protein R69658_06347 [Paraburkholderia aspalathi]SFU15194.1 hypothetical protein SAMN05192563_1011210 [Paraburkholderia aspalathi]
MATVHFHRLAELSSDVFGLQRRGTKGNVAGGSTGLSQAIRTGPAREFLLKGDKAI